MSSRIDAIRALEDASGRIQPLQLIEAARDKSHPCHNEFTWDDSVAAHKYRIHQARVIIASVRVVIRRSNKTFSSIGYVRDPTAAPNESRYVATTQLRTEEDAAQDALMREVERLQAQLERMRELAAVLDLEDEMRSMLDAAFNFSVRLRRGRPAGYEEEGAYV